MYTGQSLCRFLLANILTGTITVTTLLRGGVELRQLVHVLTGAGVGLVRADHALGSTVIHVKPRVQRRFGTVLVAGVVGGLPQQRFRLSIVENLPFLRPIRDATAVGGPADILLLPTQGGLVLQEIIPLAIHGGIIQFHILIATAITRVANNVHAVRNIVCCVRRYGHHDRIAMVIVHIFGLRVETWYVPIGLRAVGDAGAAKIAAGIVPLSLFTSRLPQ